MSTWHEKFKIVIVNVKLRVSKVCDHFASICKLNIDVLTLCLVDDQFVSNENLSIRSNRLIF